MTVGRGAVPEAHSLDSRIERARAGHGPDIVALQASDLAPPWDAASVASLLDGTGGIGFVARGAQGDIAGYILGRVAADEAEVLSVGVAKPWRRRGIGRALVRALAEEARARGAARMFLEVAEANVGATALYGRAGFRPHGRRRGYYVAPGHPPADALVLVLALDGPSASATSAT